MFEEALADFAGSKYAVAVDSCTNAIFLSCKYIWDVVPDSVTGETVREVVPKPLVILPARTYVSVPMSVIHAGGIIKFEDLDWRGVYQLKPWSVWDGAKRFRRGMFCGGYHCLSFHVKKHLCIGKGGMILTDDANAVDWLRRARYEGRSGLPLDQEEITSLGWNMYMTPEQAARGLSLLQVLPPGGLEDLTEDYPDLRKFPVFSSCLGGERAL
jgi:dTDP-4-amino-4,6-dideoxygalactose transaminase